MGFEVECGVWVGGGVSLGFWFLGGLKFLVVGVFTFGVGEDLERLDFEDGEDFRFNIWDVEG